MPSFKIEGEFITLVQALKATEQVGSGGEAKNLVRSGTVEVNGTAETQPGRKLRSGDRFAVDGGEAWTITS